ncbi:hypothetical protein LSAT2_021994 [Lamellibrachia satsuma]|nr:hypothetical protein LSAT2_021994 [Lamellibrachia satsuma]
MSFGMKHLLGVYSSAKKGLCGWYHLLTDNVGRRKHLRLSTLDSKRHAAAELPALKEVTEVNKDVLWMEAVTIVITRGQGGFAFSIAGNNPVRVSRVDMGSQADIAGLKSGDYIVRINGQNISRSTANSVAKIVRHSPEQIILDIQRPYGSKVIPRSLSSASTSENESDKENCAPVQYLHVPLPWQRLSDNGALSWQPNKEESSWQQDEKRGSVCSSLEEMKMTRTEDAMEVSSSTDTSLPSSNDKWSLGSLAELQCDFAHQRVLACESKFVEVMQSGIQRYSRPLRHRVISHSEHATLFQNVEKLVAISEFLVRSLQAQSHQTLGSDGLDCEAEHMDLGNMYQSKVSMMTAAYRAYCDGLSGAMRLLAELQTSSKFDNFLREQPLQCGQPTISEFICKPLEHLCDLVFNLQSVMTSDPSSVSLQHVVTGTPWTLVLRNCCNQISETIGKHTSSSHSLVSRSAKVSRSSLMSGSSLMSRSLMLSVSSSQLTGSSSLQSSAEHVDVEINNLLSRLVFPQHLQVRTVTPTVHVFKWTY